MVCVKPLSETFVFHCSKNIICWSPHEVAWAHRLVLLVLQKHRCCENGANEKRANIFVGCPSCGGNSGRAVSHGDSVRGFTYVRRRCTICIPHTNLCCLRNRTNWITFEAKAAPKGRRRVVRDRRLVKTIPAIPYSVVKLCIIVAIGIGLVQEISEVSVEPM